MDFFHSVLLRSWSSKAIGDSEQAIKLDKLDQHIDWQELDIIPRWDANTSKQIHKQLQSQL